MIFKHCVSVQYIWAFTEEAKAKRFKKRIFPEFYLVLQPLNKHDNSCDLWWRFKLHKYYSDVLDSSSSLCTNVCVCIYGVKSYQMLARMWGRGGRRRSKLQGSWSKVTNAAWEMVTVFSDSSTPLNAGEIKRKDLKIMEKWCLIASALLWILYTIMSTVPKTSDPK